MCYLSFSAVVYLAPQVAVMRWASIKATTLPGCSFCASVVTGASLPGHRSLTRQVWLPAVSPHWSLGPFCVLTAFVFVCRAAAAPCVPYVRRSLCGVKCPPFLAVVADAV